ncbi:MAG: metallophosphoesterase [Bacteroidales bacterium]|nr:metallophosphoesterase [Bacteroidales bacterium]
MKRLFSILVLFLSALVCWAESTQRIQVFQYIPDKENGVLSTNVTKRPLAGVSIKIAGAEPITFDSQGRATVHFSKLIEGDRVFVKELSKEGFQLFSLDTKESWYVPSSNDEVQEILMISNSDMRWIEQQWRNLEIQPTGLKYGYFSNDEHLLCIDMSTLTPLQEQTLPLLINGKFEEVIKIFDSQNFLEKYHYCVERKTKLLPEIEEDICFALNIASLHGGTRNDERFSLINSLFKLNKNLNWALRFYPKLCSELHKYWEFDQYANALIAQPTTAAADKAQLRFWQAYNLRFIDDVNSTIELQEKALALYDSIAFAIGEKDVFPMNRALLYNMLGTNNAVLGNFESMDSCYEKTRHYLQVTLDMQNTNNSSLYHFYAVQAENYLKADMKPELVHELLKTAYSTFVDKLSKDNDHLGAHLSTLQRFAHIHYLRNEYEQAYQAINGIEHIERDFYSRKPRLRAEDYCHLLILKAKICIALGKESEANTALLEAHQPINLVDRLNPGNYKEEMLEIHLLHAPLRIAAGQEHLAKSDLNRAETLAKDLYFGQPLLLDSIYNYVQHLRGTIQSRRGAAEVARARYNPDQLEFCFITDTHNFGRSADIRSSDRNIEHFVEYCNQNPAIQCAVHGGDFINAYDTDHQNALWSMEHARFQFSGLQIPFYTVKGNHDCNGKQWKGNQKDNSQIITDREYFELFSPFSHTNPLATADVEYNPKEPTRNYYYRDFEMQRVRLIFLNAYHRDSLELFGYRGEQMRWLAEEALDFSLKPDAEEWGFIIFGHTSRIETKSAINGLLEAYSKGKDSYNDVSLGLPIRWDTKQQKRAQMIALINGHYHIDNYRNANGYNHIFVTRCFATGNEVEYEPLLFSHFIVDTKNHTLTEKRIGSGHSRMYSYGERNEQIMPVRPFKSADGLGIYTCGGNTGRIIKVTNLKDEGPGSLRWAVAQPNARCIVFEQGGTIMLKQPLVIENDSITILGQSAPKPIVLKGAPLKIKASEVIVRYLTILPGIYHSSTVEDDHFGQKNIILDHLTLGASLKSSLDFRYTEDATIQRCYLSASLDEDEPTLRAGGFKVTYYNNFIEGGINTILLSNEVGTNRWNHIVRNVVVGWKERCIYGGGNQGETSITDNFFVPNAFTQDPHFLKVAEDGTSRYYIYGNRVRGYENENQKNLVHDQTGVPWRRSSKLTKNMWNAIPPVARPNSEQYGFSNTCLTVASFHFKEIERTQALLQMLVYVSKNAGNSDIKREKSAKDKDGDGIPDKYASQEEYLNSLDVE